jgi:hypothetical protein
LIYEVSLSPLFENDLFEVAKYISEKLHNTTAAKELVYETRKLVFGLDKIPARYPLVRDTVLADKGFRFFLVKNFAGFYTINEDENKVIGHRFLYKKRDWAFILSGISL